MRSLAKWEQDNPGTVHDPEWFRRDVLPRLARVKLSEIAEAGPGQRFFWVDVERSDALARLRRDCAFRLARHRDIEGTTAVGVLPSQLATRAPRMRPCAPRRQG